MIFFKYPFASWIYSTEKKNLKYYDTLVQNVQIMHRVDAYSDQKPNATPNLLLNEALKYFQKKKKKCYNQ